MQIKHFLHKLTLSTIKMAEGAKILGNMCIVIIFCQVCNVINFETNHSLHEKNEKI